MSVYNFYNDEYGIRLSLELNEDKEELRYQCLGIEDEWRGMFTHYCDNGWDILSCIEPEISIHIGKTLFLCGSDQFNDNILTIVGKSGTYTRKGNRTMVRTGVTPGSYSVIEQVYHELIDALEELGNDYSQAKEILNM